MNSTNLSGIRTRITDFEFGAVNGDTTCTCYAAMLKKYNKHKFKHVFFKKKDVFKCDCRNRPSLYNKITHITSNMFVVSSMNDRFAFQLRTFNVVTLRLIKINDTFIYSSSIEELKAMHNQVIVKNNRLKQARNENILLSSASNNLVNLLELSICKTTK